MAKMSLTSSMFSSKLPTGVLMPNKKSVVKLIAPQVGDLSFYHKGKRQLVKIDSIKGDTVQARLADDTQFTTKLSLIKKRRLTIRE